MTKDTLVGNEYLSEYVKYVSLNVLGMVAISCYILADTFFISKGIGSAGLTALNLALPFFSIIRGFGLMLGMGGGTRYSVLTARGSRNEAARNFTVTVRNTLVISLLFFVGGLCFSNQLTVIMGADEAAFQMTHTYLKTLLMFAPLFLFNDVLICFVRNDGAPQLAMIGMLMGSFINIILDYVFIFPLNLGILGAVLATGVSPGVGIIISMTHWMSKGNGLKFVGPLHKKERITITTVAIGCPSLVNEISTGIVIFVFNMVILDLSGNIGVAAYGIIANLSYVVIAMFTGISEGLQPLTSREYGFGNGPAIRRLFRYGIISAVGAAILIYFIILMFSEPLTAVFNSEGNKQLANLAEGGMRIYFIGMIFAGFNIVAAIFFTSIQRPIQAQVISLLRGLVVIVPATFILADIFGVDGVWLSFPVTEIIVMMVGIVQYFILANKKVY